VPLVWLLYLPVLAELLPPIAVVWKPTRSPARLGIAAWSLVMFFGDVLAVWEARHYHKNNLWVGYVSTAIAGTVLLWALSWWQSHSVSRLAIRVLIPLYLLAQLALILTVEDPDNFSLVTDTLSGVVLLTLVLYTLVVRSLEERDQLTRFDWFWVCSGLALSYSSAMAIGPISRLLIVDHRELVLNLYEVRAIADTVAITVIARGLLCPMPSLRSGGSSLPPSSPSSSS
jgi:hypothetical protein